VATIVVYGQVKDYEFIDLDDDRYVIDNTNVQTGLTLKSIAWAFTTTHPPYWHPITWISHILDFQLYGMNPGQHHLTSVLFHILNTLLLFIVFRKMTKDLWKSSFIAAVFALHPLNVESVAWVAERKNVLCTFFWMLTIWSYTWYVERKRFDRYLLVLFFFIMGLMAKPMIVTLPFVLFLMDYWPLRRFQFNLADYGMDSNQKSHVFRLLLEKIPFLVFSALSSVVTFICQKKVGTVAPLEVFSIHIRIENALVSYVSYIGKMFWPNNLAILYPHPGMLPIKQVAGAGILLLSISLLAIWAVKQRPWFIVGWLWFTGTLIPVIGLVQVGVHSMADRFAYLPLIGIYIMIAWGIPELLPRWRFKKKAISITVAIVLLILMTTTLFQVRYWINSLTIFEHSLKLTANNYLLHYNLGNVLRSRGRILEAIHHYSEALRIKPDHEKAHNNLGVAFIRKGNIEGAVKHFREALRIKPDYAEAHNNLGVAFIRKGNIEGAIKYFREALRIKPDFLDARNNLKNAMMSQQPDQ